MLKVHLEKLVHFVGAVKAGSIRSYSIHGRLSQPSVSKSIQILETEMEATLLIRSRDGIRLTKQGEALFAFGEKMLIEADDVDQQIRTSGKLVVSGALTMGSYQSIAVYFVPSFVEFIRKEQKDLTLSLVTASSRDLVKSLRAGEVDFIVSVDPPHSKEFHQVQLFTDRYSMYRRSGYRESLSSSLIFTLPEARDQDGKTLREYLVGAKLDSRLSACGDFETVKAMVERGVGFGILPDRVAEPLVLAGKIELVPGRKITGVGQHNVVFSCKKHRESDQALKWIQGQLGAMLG